MNRSETLTTAEALINGDRAKDYGDAAENFQRIADLWAPILRADVTAAQVALCLTQLKVARLIQSPTHEDSWVDACGYLALGSEIAAQESRPNQWRKKFNLDTECPQSAANTPARTSTPDTETRPAKHGSGASQGGLAVGTRVRHIGPGIIYGTGSIHERSNLGIDGPAWNVTFDSGGTMTIHETALEVIQ